MDIWTEIRSALEDLRDRDLLRSPLELESGAGPRVTVGGRQIICMCSNDYLALACDPALKQAACDAVQQWGVGSGASRLVSGTMSAHRDLERTIAEFKCAEDAVVTSTGWMANRAAICALARAGDLVLCDKLDHASIIDAARGCGARLRTYAHRDCARLRRILDERRAKFKRCLIVTDSLFSMDGDLAPLEELVDIKRSYDAALVIDEAHATGVLGEGGRGAAEHLGVEDDIDVTVGTLSKAVGCLGGFVAGPRVMCDMLRNTARSYIYTTALPPAICAAAKAAFGIIRSEPWRRQRLLEIAGRLRSLLRDEGFDTLDSAGQIVPVVIGGAGRAKAVAESLLDQGFLIPAIRPPTVARGTSRLRISLCSAHEDGDIDRLPGVLSSAFDGA
jgi:glycine C-acetyltransferase/8-amino-7-oxononanoate synthase